MATHDQLCRLKSELPILLRAMWVTVTAPMLKASSITQMLRGIGILAMSGVLGVAIFLGLLWNEHNTVTRLPAPTGPYAVGRTIYTWSAASQTDKLAPLLGTTRELIAWIWYPAANNQPDFRTEYLPAQWRAAVERERGMLNSKFITRDLSLVHVHSTQDANLSPALQTYPVVIMRAGLAALTVEYSTLAEDLASHGYVVVGFDAPLRTAVVVFSDGRVVTRTPENDPEVASGPERDRIIGNLLAAWSSDMAFALDQLGQMNTGSAPGRFTGRLDLRHIGVVGHSLGGATAAQFCHEDARCRAGIDVDGAPYGSVIRDGMSKPFMFLVSDHGPASDPDIRRVSADIQSIYDWLPPEGRLWIAIKGANHFGFSDGLLIKNQQLLWLLRLLGITNIDPRQQLAATAYSIHTFFDIYLKAAPTSTLHDLSVAYPEIQVVRQP